MWGICIAARDCATGSRAALIEAGFLSITFPKTEDEQESGGRCGSRGVVCDVYPETKVCTSVEVALCAAYFTGGPEFVVRMVLSGADLKTEVYRERRFG